MATAEKGGETVATVMTAGGLAPIAAGAAGATFEAQTAMLAGAPLGTSVGLTLGAGMAEFGTVYLGTRFICQNTGVDRAVTNGFESAVFNEGKSQLDAIESRTSATAATIPMMDNRELAYRASSDSKTVARAITGTLTQIEQATASGDQAALQAAQAQMQRLRAAQRGELGVA